MTHTFVTLEVSKEVYDEIAAKLPMSEWYKADDDDIELDREAQEVEVFVKQDHFGNIYVTLTFDQVRDVMKKIEQSGPRS